MLEACNGDEALRMVQQGGNRIDIVLTDVVMPSMDDITDSTDLKFEFCREI